MAKVLHPFFSSPQSSQNVHDYMTHKITPQEYINALSGNYADYTTEALRNPGDYRPTRSDFFGHHHDTEQNNSIILNNLINKLKDPEIRENEFKNMDLKTDLQNLVNSKLSEQDFKKLHNIEMNGSNIFDNDWSSIHKSPHMKGDLLSDQLRRINDDQENWTRNAKLKDLIENNPNIEPRHINYILRNRPKSLDDIIRNGHLDKIDDKALGRILDDKTNYEHMNPQSLDKILDRMTPENRKRFIDDHLGMTGGDVKDSQEENWDNWSDGDKYNHEVAQALAQSRHLDPAQVDHIKRHGSDDVKFKMFNSPHLSPEVAQEMHDKYLNDDSHHGYDLDKFKRQLVGDYNANDVLENDNGTIRQQAEEHYPFKEFLKDNYSDQDIMGQNKDSWIDEYLNNHPGGWNVEREDDSGNNYNEDLSDYKMDHPDYDQRYNDAEDAWDDAVDRARENYNGESDNYKKQDAYDDALREYEWELANDKFSEIKDNAHNDQDFYPEHLHETLPALIRAKLSEQDRKKLEAWDKAAQDTAKHSDYLKGFMPNGYATQYQHGEGLHHLEMAKKYADANGGVIDFGTLNKKHPNLVNNWKRIFGNNGGKLNSQQLQAMIDSVPKQNYNLSYVPWKSNLQNINNQNQVVMRLDHSPESLQQLEADPQAHEVFKKINDVSQRSGHPTNHNTIGWARVDMSNPKHWMIDEVQRDHDSAARKFLQENGKPEEAEALGRVMNLHKNWREQLFNAVQKLAEHNGVEKISTHSPQSKAAHTGASKVHTVYRDSYEKAPRQLGYKPDLMNNLPLTNSGREVFASGMNSNARDAMNQHYAGMDWHAKLWHQQLEAQNRHSEAGYEKEADDLSKLVDFHRGKFAEHHARLQQIDPTDSRVKFNHPQKYIQNGPASARFAPDEQVTRSHFLLSQERPNDIPQIAGHESDALLQKDPVIGTPNMGHTLDLSPAAFKKNILELINLLKAENGDSNFEDTNMKIIEAVQFMEQNQEALEQIRQTNPEAFSAINQIMQSLMEVFKETRGESIQAIAQQMEMQNELQNQMGQDSPDESPEAQEISFGGGPKKDEPAHNHRTTYTVGQERDHADGERREKQPDGSWKVITSGISQPQGGQ